jgi:hypothetical protein
LPQPPSEETTAILRRALRTLLRPLVRLLLQNQLTYPALTALLKEVYVDVADGDFPLPGKRQTDSRVSLLTGIHRKEVSRLRGQSHDDEAPPRSASLGTLILSRWVGVADFHGPDGRPRPLPRQAGPAGAASFESLVESVSKDIRPRAVLDEWLRLGVAHLDANDHVVLNTESFVADRGFEEKAYFFGRNLRDHIAAGAHNLEGGAPPFVDRSVYYAHLSQDSARELEELSRERGMDALRAVNSRALELQQRDAADPQAARHRLNFGIYFFQAEQAPDPAAGDAPEDAPEDGHDDAQS